MSVASHPAPAREKTTATKNRAESNLWLSLYIIYSQQLFVLISLIVSLATSVLSVINTIFSQTFIKKVINVLSITTYSLSTIQ